MKYCQECCLNFEKDVSSNIIKQIYKTNRFAKLKSKLDRLKNSIKNEKSLNACIECNGCCYNNVSSNTTHLSEAGLTNSQALIGNLHYDDNIEVVGIKVKKLNALASISQSENSEIILKPIEFFFEKTVNQTKHIYCLKTGICFQENRMVVFAVSIDEESKLQKYEILTTECFADNKEILIRISSESLLTPESLKKIFIHLSLKKRVNFKLTQDQDQNMHD
jgi:hypothetical protein